MQVYIRDCVTSLHQCKNIAMKCNNKYLQGIVLFVGLTAITCAEIKDKRQVNTEVAAGEEDRVPSETGFAEAVHAGGKYYQDIYMAQHNPHEIEFGHVRETDDDWEQRFEKIFLGKPKRQGKVLITTYKYAHVPAKDHYEFGEKRGNEHHFIERHEKAHPHAGEFKTKVKWGDKHGGYGEHYWDYNHAGHDHDGGGEESKNEEEYAAYEPSDKAPVVVKARQRRDLLDGDVEYINERARSLVENGGGSKHGGNYKREPSSVSPKQKRQNFHSPTFNINPDAEFQARGGWQNPVKIFNY